MNIFILDNDIKKNAEYHCDKHVVKMIVEYAQMLCTANNINGLTTPYRSTHVNHPCSIWTRSSLSNWRYLRQLIEELNNEWKKRYNHTRNHKSFDVVASIAEPNIEDIGLTEFAQAMPEEYKSVDTVEAYRDYYIGEKQAFATWKSSKPHWWPY